MKYVLRDHGQLHLAVDGDVQGIDLMLTPGMLGLPHPLLAHDVNVHGIGGRVIDAEDKAAHPKQSRP